MLQNPFGSQQNPSQSSYVNLQKRLLENVQATRVDDQIFSAVQKSFEDALRMEDVQLTSPEKKRMLAQVMKKVLTGMLAKLDDSPKA